MLHFRILISIVFSFYIFLLKLRKQNYPRNDRSIEYRYKLDLFIDALIDIYLIKVVMTYQLLVGQFVGRQVVLRLMCLLDLSLGTTTSCCTIVLSL